MRTKEQMYKDIRNWEMDAGEDFLDYFDGSMNPFNFMFWCLGKGYITEEQLQSFEKVINSHGTEYLFGDEDYSVVNEEQYEDDYDAGLEKAYRILADFLTTTATYQKRVDNFLNDITPIKFEDALKNFRRYKVFFIVDGVKTYMDENTELSAKLISKAKWYYEN